MTEILSKEESEAKTQEQLNKIKTPCPCKKKTRNGEELERRITAFSDCASQCIVWRMPYEVAVDMLVSFKETEKNKEQSDVVMKHCVNCDYYREWKAAVNEENI